MKIMAIDTKRVYEIELRKAGENLQICPVCSSDRKKKNSKPFSFNAEKGQGYCNHCNTSFTQYKERYEQKTYFVPQWKNDTKLSDKAVKWFESRGISHETVNAFKIYSDNIYFPQINKETSCVAFPYFYNDKLVNVKYRTGDKLFTLIKDAELIFYNIDSVSEEVVIVEGEIDALSFWQSGIKSVISVPNGASNFGFLDDCIDLLKDVKRVCLATDQDVPGVKLRDELARRIGTDRCYIVNFKDKKDANEYLTCYGGFELYETVKAATAYPISGIIDLKSSYNDTLLLYKEGMKRGAETGISDLDNIVTWETGRVCVATGIPTHGKSAFIDFMVSCLCITNGWKAGYFSPENFPVPVHIHKLISIISGKKFNKYSLTENEFNICYDFVQDNISFVMPDEDYSLDSILERASYLVKKNGIKVFVIDPWNKIDHQFRPGENETSYISRVLDQLDKFAKKFNVLVILVAHPKKQDKDKDTQKFNKPTLYDISGSAHFYNKADYGIVVYRDFQTNVITVDIPKVKFLHLGGGGSCQFLYNTDSFRYEPVDSDRNEWNSDSFLIRKPYVRFSKTSQVQSYSEPLHDTDMLFEEQTDSPF